MVRWPRDVSPNKDGRQTHASVSMARAGRDIAARAGAEPRCASICCVTGRAMRQFTITTACVGSDCRFRRPLQSFRARNARPRGPRRARPHAPRAERRAHGLGVLDRPTLAVPHPSASGTTADSIGTLSSFSRLHRAQRWEGTFGEFLSNILPGNAAALARSSHEYIWDMLRWHGRAAQPDAPARARELFKRELFGID